MALPPRWRADPESPGEAPRFGRFARAALALVALVALVAGPTDGYASGLPRDDDRPGSYLSLDRPARISLARALNQAAKKLESAPCRQVFSDYRDGKGRTLLANLEATGLDGSAHLRSLTFATGRFREDCRLPNVLALATPGRALIYICGPQFVQHQVLDPGFTSALLIHEQLHALGLGENPPDSRAITARVISRCGR